MEAKDNSCDCGAQDQPSHRPHASSCRVYGKPDKPDTVYKCKTIDELKQEMNRWMLHFLDWSNSEFATDHHQRIANALDVGLQRIVDAQI